MDAADIEINPFAGGPFRNLLRFQFARFLTVGSIAGGCDLTLNALLSEGLNWHPLAANLVSRPVGGIISFLLNKGWTFGNRGKAEVHIQAMRFLTVWLCCFAVSELLIGFYHEFLHLRPILSKLGGEATLGIFSFLLQKFWTFRQ